MKSYRAVCLDMDGTVYKGNEVIKEAVPFIHSLQSRGIEPYYVTNNSSMTAAEFQSKLLRMDIVAPQDRIMTSAIATAEYCKKEYNGASAYVIGENGLREALLSAGIRLTDTDPDIVVAGIDRKITYKKLADACLSMRKGAPLIATNGDLAFPAEAGIVPGNGAFVKLLESAGGSLATFVGKPEPYMLEFIQEKGYSKDEMVMVGDNYDTDILCGIRFGIDTVYVEGGVTSAEEITQKEHKPTYQMKSLAEWIL